MKNELQNRQSQVDIRKLSELLILSVISRLGPVRLHDLVGGLKLATQGAKVPFFVGSTLRDQLQQYTAVDKLRSREQGFDLVYFVTPVAKRELSHFDKLLKKSYPSILQIKSSKPIANSTVDRVTPR